MIMYIFLFFPLFGFSQNTIPKKTNTIELGGVSFKEIANGLLDVGYTFEKIDSNYQTIKTEFKNGNGKNKWMRLRLIIRTKDSITTITGEWYPSTVIGTKLFGVEQTIENSTYKIEYTYGNSKNCFLEMNAFALSFKKSITYVIK